MKFFLIYLIFNINYYVIASLDFKFYQDMFLLSCISQKSNNLIVSIQETIEMLILNSYFLISLLSVIYIIFSLFCNMFHYSIKYFFVNFIFNQKKLILPNN